MECREGINLFSLEERKEYLTIHSKYSIEFSTIQQGMSYYDIDGIGYIAFRETFLSRIHILGNPVAEADHYETLFIALAKAKKIASAAQINEEFALILKSHGYIINRLGFESSIDTNQFTLTRKIKKLPRKAKNICLKGNISVVRFNAEKTPRIN